MRRQDREMDEKFGLYVIDKAGYAVMTTIDENGMPYSFPISPARIENTLYIHAALEGRKISNIKNNPIVTMVFVGETNIPEPINENEYEEYKDKNSLGKLVAKKFTMEYESAIITGNAYIVSVEEEKIKGLKAISIKYTPENMKYFEAAVESSLSRTCIMKIEIGTITAKRKKYDSTGEEMKWGR